MTKLLSEKQKYKKNPELDNDLLPILCQAIATTNVNLELITSSKTRFYGILSISFEKMILDM